jgi:putative ABC transport system permease protein
MVSRGWAWFYTYVLICENQSVDAVRAKMPDFTARFYQEFGTREEISARTKQHLQPITDIHLHSRLEQEMGPNSNIIYVYIFACVALFILLIAGVNFINIATAQAFKRMKEVGVRKVLGAYRHQLQKQFLGESYIMSLIAAAFALMIFDITLPFYNQLAGKNLSFVRVLTPENIGFLVLIIVLVGTLAYFAMNSWLQNFAYRIDIDVWAFILSGVVAIGVAILTVSYQSIKAAIANPIDSLRYE